MSGENESSSAVIATLIDEYYPKGAPLSGIYKKGFAYKTIGYRLPVILTQIIDHLSRDKNEIGDNLGPEAREDVKGIVGRLAKVKNEMQTNKPISSLGSPVWDSYLDHIASTYFDGNKEDVRWFIAPWLYVECYLYHRINEAFKGSRHLQTYDYFRKQKEEGFFESVEAAELLGGLCCNVAPNETNLQSLLEVSLWGNRCDLSISAGQSNSQSVNLLDGLVSLRDLILCDDSPQFWKSLRASKAAKVEKSSAFTLGYVLDNAGFELFTDLCLADALLHEVDRVDFYVKDMPWFVSDALATDFHWLLDAMSKTDKPILTMLSAKWKEFVKSNRWNIIEDPFWCYPHAFNEMKEAKPSLYSVLSSHAVLIFKGDLNYRKLVGDMNWEPTTPFADAIRGFIPAPLIALRTIKADTVSGLKAGVAEGMSQREPDWMVNGKFGIMQFAS